MPEIVLSVTVADLDKVLERVEEHLGKDDANLLRAWLRRPECRWIPSPETQGRCLSCDESVNAREATGECSDD